MFDRKEFKKNLYKAYEGFKSSSACKVKSGRKSLPDKQVEHFDSLKQQRTWPGEAKIALSFLEASLVTEGTCFSLFQPNDF